MTAYSALVNSLSRAILHTVTRCDSAAVSALPEARVGWPRSLLLAAGEARAGAGVCAPFRTSWRTSYQQPPV